MASFSKGWCRNSKTSSNESSEYLVNCNGTVCGEHDKIDENRSKCPAVSSMFPHS